MTDDDYETIDKRVKELKADLPAAVEASGLISEYAVKSPHGKYDKELNSRFTIKKIESGELWLEDFENTGELTGPVLVSEEISSLCRVYRACVSFRRDQFSMQGRLDCRAPNREDRG